ncbi:hypothetical protein F5Y15DRAFT_219501 [Xylariaceae sp. FL0016]|nr:hypothetical protein F5Y15DRAFT_219501 [Xylariaceae sp. FL0016]
MARITITEPHPTVRQNTYTHSGRGGAGNYFRAPATTPATGIPTTTEGQVMPASTTSRFHSGRGGAGNAHQAAERPVLSFDEEYKRHSTIEQKPISHVGRGGAGNVYSSRKSSDASSHHSVSSSSSSGSGFLGRVSSHFSRR